MRKRQGYKAFTDEEVRVIKTNLVIGVTCGALARVYGVSEGTISRIRRGLAYGHVRVEGEEDLRPAVEVVGLTPKGVEVMTGMTEEEADRAAEESAARLMASLKVERAVQNAPEEILDAARRYLGNQADALLPKEG